MILGSYGIIHTPYQRMYEGCACRSRMFRSVYAHALHTSSTYIARCHTCNNGITEAQGFGITSIDMDTITQSFTGIMVLVIMYSIEVVRSSYRV